ncbi:unnamed protein product, partial [Mesorhabditis belari]|uniref:Uncharacterized protein n=1 Tax=Mesorhabditis belari TaxID=2138241 RepID=A0AAF3EC90_9BILA
MMPKLALIKGSFLWRFKYVFIVIVLTVLLLGLYYVLGLLYDQAWYYWTPHSPFDITYKLKGKISYWLVFSQFVGSVLSIFITPFAIYFPMRNDRLSLPVRLLAVNEGVARGIYSVVYTCAWGCDYIKKLPNGQKICSYQLDDAFSTVAGYVLDSSMMKDVVHNVAQFSQLLISLRRCSPIRSKTRPTT